MRYSLVMAKQFTNITFQKNIKHYYSVLKSGYLKEIEKASDKEYAKQHFQTILFLENEFIPNQSILFDGLKLAYEHYYRLNPETAFDETFELLPNFQNSTKNARNKSIEHLNGDKNSLIPDHYLAYIRSNQFTLTELIQSEELVLKSNFESLATTLALYIAGQNLYKEFKTDVVIESTEKQETNYQHTFTQKQQVLALYFLMKAYGINAKLDSDMTTLSALYHLVLGIPFKSFDKLKNTSIYKYIRLAPEIFNNDTYYLKNLKIIRPYFSNIKLINAVELIDIQINRCESK